MHKIEGFYHSQFALAHEYLVMSEVSQFFGSEGVSLKGFSSAHEYSVIVLWLRGCGLDGL